MKEILEKEIEATFSQLSQLVSSFSEEKLNVVPFENSWTAGQVTEHIIKGLSGATVTLNGSVEKTEREPSEKVKFIRDLFLDFTTKMKSPDFILPGNGPHNKDELLKSIDKLKNEMLDANKLDLSLLCLDFELPNSGKFTRLEWINFFLTHTQRHTHQLENIYHTLNK